MTTNPVRAMKYKCLYSFNRIFYCCYSLTKKAIISPFFFFYYSHCVLVITKLN